MSGLSRRQIARYAVDELLAGRQPKNLADRVAAALVASGHYKELDLLLADIDQELEDRGLLTKARVASAHPLSAKLHKELEAKVKSMTGTKGVSIEHRLDKDLLGGIRVETANHTWDKTLRRVLIDIKEKA